MNFETLIARLLADLCQRFPLGYEPAIVWRAYRVSAGMAYYQTGVIGLSNIVIQDEQKLADTLKHEYAHLLAYQRHGKAGVGHGAHWKQAMRDVGLEPKVHHCYEVQRNRRLQEVGYLCKRCGAILIRPRRLPKRRRYLHAGCGGSIKYAWTRSVIPAQHDA